MFVAVFGPCRELPGQCFLVWNAAVEALRGKDAELGFGHVEPASLLWRVVPFEALDQAPLAGVHGLAVVANMTRVAASDGTGRAQDVRERCGIDDAQRLGQGRVTERLPI